MKKFLTVLLALSVVFTYSFATVGNAFAVTSADQAEEQALISAKEAAVSSLENLVRLSDYDAEGQAKVKEIIEEGTTLINLQTDIAGVTSTLAKYQERLLKVTNANQNALAAAKKAAKDALDDYADVLYESEKYAKDAFDDIINNAKTNIDKQLSVIGVEFARDAAFEKMETVEMADGTVTDAEAAKKLATAKADAILNVKGDESATNKWRKIGEDIATAEQIAAYKAKVNEVVAFIKAADSEAELGKYAREKAEVEALAAATEKDAAQAKVKEEIYNWAKAADYATYADIYGGIKTAVENIGFGSTSDALKFGNEVVTYNKKNVVVKDMGDVDTAVSRGIDYLKNLDNTALADAQTAAKANLATYKDRYDATVEDLFTAERAVDAATTSAKVAEIVAKYRSAWRLSAMADDEAYKAAVTKADADIKAAVAGIEAATDDSITADELKAAKELYEAAMLEIKNEYLYDNFKKHIPGIVNSVVGIINDFSTESDDYAAILAELKETAVREFDLTTASDAGERALMAQILADIDKCTNIVAVYKTVVEGQAKVDAYEADSTDPLIARFAAYKKAVAAIEALPEIDEVTLADKDAVLAAYKAYVNDGVLATNAYCEEYGTADAFVGEADALKKIEALKKEVEETLAGKVNTFKNDAYTRYLTSSKYNTYTAAQQAQLDKIYADAVAAMNKAADTKYADDIDYIAEDALAEMAGVVNKYGAEDLAKMVADAKAFLKTIYNPADYTAADLAEIDRIIATVDGATDLEQAAKLTIAARKEIAKVGVVSTSSKELAIAAVKAFKIRTTTERYTGKKMVVKWKVVEGDESAIDGYRIYFSTKKTNSGYKYLAKTTKKYINHTSIKKNVKKGTRVFYRVRAYAEIDGVRYFSDYSTVGNRIWK